MATKEQVQTTKEQKICYHNGPVVIGDYLYHWVPDRTKASAVNDQLDVFDIKEGKWRYKIETNSTPPPHAKGYCSTVVGERIYYFGGRSIVTCELPSESHYNCITELDTKTLRWKEISRQSSSQKSVMHVMPRGYGKMIALEINKESYLLMIGGVGTANTQCSSQSAFDYTILEKNRTRTNEQNAYNLSLKKWVSVSISGQCMPPNSGFVIEKLSATTALIFGGVQNNDCPTNNLYKIEATKKGEGINIKWETILANHLEWPEARYIHASSLIYGSTPSQTTLVVTGGMHHEIKQECWLMNINNKTWSKVSLPDIVTKRCGHSMSAFIMGPKCIWIIVMGGFYVSSEGECPKKENVLIEIVLNEENQWSLGSYFELSRNHEKYKKQFQQTLIDGRKHYQQLVTSN